MAGNDIHQGDTSKTLRELYDEFTQAQRDVRAAWVEDVGRVAVNLPRRHGKTFQKKVDLVSTLGITLLNRLEGEGLGDWIDYRDSQHLLDAAEDSDADDISTH